MGISYLDFKSCLDIVNDILGWPRGARKKELKKEKKYLPPLVFRQVGVWPVDFQALPGPEGRAFREKTMRRFLFPRPGGQVILPPRTRLIHCRSPAGRPMRPPCTSTVQGPPHPAEAREDLRSQFFSRRCFFRATPLLPGHKLAFLQKKQGQE
jgi:hypothetical protein